MSTTDKRESERPDLNPPHWVKNEIVIKAKAELDDLERQVIEKKAFINWCYEYMGSAPRFPGIKARAPEERKEE